MCPDQMDKAFSQSTTLCAIALCQAEIEAIKKGRMAANLPLDPLESEGQMTSNGQIQLVTQQIVEGFLACRTLL